MCIYLAIFLNSSLKASLNHPYKIGFENAEDMPIKWQKAKHIRLACSLWKRGKNSIPLSILIGHFSVENNHSIIFWIHKWYLFSYLLTSKILCISNMIFKTFKGNQDSANITTMETSNAWVRDCFLSFSRSRLFWISNGSSFGLCPTS